MISIRERPQTYALDGTTIGADKLLELLGIIVPSCVLLKLIILEKGITRKNVTSLYEGCRRTDCQREFCVIYS
jgi:hypothetical protein